MVPSGGLLPTVEPTACADSGKANSPMPPAHRTVGTPESYASTSYLPRLPSFINNHPLTLPQLLSDSMPFGDEAAGLGLRLPPPEGLERNGLTMSPTVAHFAPEDTTIIAGDSLARALRAYQPSISNQDIPSTRHPSPERNEIPTGQGYEQAADLAMANALPPRMPPPIMPKQNISSQQNSTPLPPVFTPSSVGQSPPSFLTKEPANLREVSICLSAVKKFLSSHGSELRGLGDRLDAVERPVSFSQSRDQDLVDKVDIIEARIIEVESKLDQHHRALSGGSGLGRKRHGDSETGSLTSGHANSFAEEHHNVEFRLQTLEERFEELDKNMPPSSTRPLEIEVLLVPWGRDLRGLWVTADENLKHQPFENSQESGEWTNTRNGRSSSHVTASLAVGSERGHGWTSQAIYDWAESTAEWLVPRACGVKSIVYHRLRSRGFVRTVLISRPGAKDIQEAITKAFGPTLKALNRQDLPDEADDSTDPGSSFFGLSAPFMPLRKAYGSSRLQFLTKSEMVTSALWAWEFLMSGVVMKASGGAKRLFITHREAYVQRADTETAAWTWDRLRKLPRVGSDLDARLGEAEPYWDEHPILDAPPPSVGTSFASHSEKSGKPRHAESNADLMDAENLALSEEERRSGSQSPTVLFAPVTPVTNPSTQDVTAMVQPRPSTPHPDPSSGSFAVPPHGSRTASRRHTRAASNPAMAANSTSLIGRTTQMRSFSPTTETVSPAKKRVASVRRFETPTNPLIASIPNFLPSPRTTRSSSDHKRRKVERDCKRAPTPVGPYATPYSGNWGGGSTGALEGVGGETSDDGEVWEGVDEDVAVCDNGGNADNTRYD
jgi:hypothetical protein